MSYLTRQLLFPIRMVTFTSKMDNAVFIIDIKGFFIFKGL